MSNDIALIFCRCYCKVGFCRSFIAYLSYTPLNFFTCSAISSVSSK